MLDYLKKVFGKTQTEGFGETQPRRDGDIRIATCALFLEMANIDNEFSDEERSRILSIIKSEYGVSEDEAIELARNAMSELKESIDLWQFTNLINENYTDAEKMRVVGLLWRIVYADGKLDKHEDYLVHKLASLLRLSNKQLMAAKLSVIRGQ